MIGTFAEDRKLKLLIVDDETGFAEVLCKRMERRGMDAFFALSGEEAVLMLRQTEFDVAIVDLKLQGMDGIEILKVFRLMAPEMPVLMLSGHGSEDARNQCLQSGAADYLFKPFEFEQLYRKARSLGTGSVPA